MTFDPRCPIEPRGVALGEELCVRLFNLSRCAALSLSGTIAMGGRSIAFDLPVNAAGRSFFELHIALPEPAAPTFPEITFQRVRFQSAPDWVQAPGPRLPLAPVPRLDLDSQLLLKRRFGSDAIRFPCAQNGAVYCACGRANEPSARTCPRCGRRLRGLLNEPARRTHLLRAECAAAFLLIFLIAGISGNVSLDRIGAHVIMNIMEIFA